MNRIIKKAFTLIELLVVIAIIGILSGLIVVSMGGMTTKATIAKAQVFSNSLKNSLMTNLISEYKFDGTGITDGVAADTTYTKNTWNGNNNCTISGAPTVLSGSNCINGSCLKFNGSDYLSCGTGTGLNITNILTISFWFKASANNTSILSRDWNQWRFYSYPLSIYNIRDGANSSWATNWSYQNNIWYSVVWTNTGSQEALYVNGVLQNSRSVSGVLTSTGALEIGAWGSSEFFNGLIDDVRIFNAAISTSQIKEQYYAGLNNFLSNEGIAEEEYAESINLLASNE